MEIIFQANITYKIEVVKLGMKTWKSFQVDRTQLCCLLLDRMKTMVALESAKNTVPTILSQCQLLFGKKLVDF